MVCSLVKRLFLLLVALVIVYIGSYAWFRSSHVERWDRDGRDYVIFPQQPALYIYIGRSRISTRDSQGCVFTSGHIGHDATPII